MCVVFLDSFRTSGSLSDTASIAKPLYDLKATATFHFGEAG